MKPKAKQKGIKKKYKRLVAAVAGAAVMSSVMLPGGIALAEENPSQNPVVNSSSLTKADLLDTANSPLAKADRPSGDIPDKDKDGSTKDKGDRDKARHWRGDPVDIVRDNASTYGFDRYHDRFSLLSKTDSKAVVQVRTDGQTFKVDLLRRGGRWVITTIRGIGNSNQPATYTPANLFPRSVVGFPANPQVSQTIFATGKYSDWQWNESAYPADMSFGLFLHDPRGTDLAKITPPSVLDQLGAIDFNRQLVFYAHMGFSSPGYGIGIEKIVQTNNELTIFVRAKSPASESRLTSQSDDIIAISRASLNLAGPVKVTFADTTGHSLRTYMLTVK